MLAPKILEILKKKSDNSLLFNVLRDIAIYETKENAQYKSKYNDILNDNTAKILEVLNNENK